MLQIVKTQAAGAVLKDSVFETSTGFFARWKSSNSLLSGNTFAESKQVGSLSRVTALRSAVIPMARR